MNFLKLILSIFRKNERIANQEEMSYDKMLERAYIKLAIKEMEDETVRQCCLKIRSAELVEKIEQDEAAIKMREEILALKFFNKLLNYLYEIYLYRDLMTEADDENQKQYILIKIENLFENLKRDSFFYLLLL